MPANRATSSGSPLGFWGSAAITAAESSTKADAVAVRRVGCLALTSTMPAWPAGLKWERGGGGPGGGVGGGGDRGGRGGWVGGGRGGGNGFWHRAPYG